MACATFYVAPESFAAFLCGQWKRNLQWHGLGGMFPHQRSSSSAVIIAAAELGALAEPGSTFLTWVFGEGRGEGEISMQCIPVPADDGVQEQQGAAATRCLLNWTRKGVAGHGVYKADLGIATLHFEGPGSQATVTYRILDGDTLGVCVVQADRLGNATVQMGNMCRLQPSGAGGGGDYSTD